MENQFSTKLNLFSFQLQFLDFQRFQKMFVHSVHPFSIQTITIPVTIFPLLAIISIARHMLLEEPLSFCSEIQNSDTGKKARFKNFHNIVHIVYTCSTLNLTAGPSIGHAAYKHLSKRDQTCTGLFYLLPPAKATRTSS